MVHFPNLKQQIRIDGVVSVSIFWINFKRGFDIYKIFSPASLAAPYFVGAALDYEVISTFYIDRRAFIVAKIMIRPGSELDGLSVRQLYEITQLWVIAYNARPGHSPAFDSEAQVIPLHQQGTTFHPDPEFVIRGGDNIYFIGPYDYLVSAYQFNKQRKQQV